MLVDDGCIWTPDLRADGLVADKVWVSLSV